MNENKEERQDIEEKTSVESDNTSEKEKTSKGAEDKTEGKDKIASFGKMLKKSLSGDVLAKNAIKKQTGVILLVAFFILLGTSNRYSCQQAHIKEDKLKKELSDAKNRAFSSFSILTEKSRKSKLIEGLKEKNDTTLQVSKQPPYIVEIPNEE